MVLLLRALSRVECVSSWSLVLLMESTNVDMHQSSFHLVAYMYDTHFYRMVVHEFRTTRVEIVKSSMLMPCYFHL